ncbi:large ribosomal subunit protein bL19m [Culicoides brevitarsis]|uniref:large ribosomal subunit protein bL19m n=1 Tax=Culicoides brevitarsis TaxID=469753 RepID=UPI00307C2E64
MLLNSVKVLNCVRSQCRGYASRLDRKKVVTVLNIPKKGETLDQRSSAVPPNYRHVYQEFLPDPKVEWRNSVKEKLERQDMLNRRKHIDIPEFYVGSVLAVTTSDPHAEGKTNRFVGICIDKERCGLRTEFTLRNVIDHQGIEVRYEMYDPTIQKIECLRLEKRLDPKLWYLRDCLPEYSTFDVNMEPEILPEDAPVPVNPIKVIMKPRPWLKRWDRLDLQGVANINDFCKEKHRIKTKRMEQPWEKYDLMKEYRRSIPEEEQQEILQEVHAQMHSLEHSRKQQKRKRVFNKPQKLA